MHQAELWYLRIGIGVIKWFLEHKKVILTYKNEENVMESGEELWLWKGLLERLAKFNFLSEGIHLGMIH